MKIAYLINQYPAVSHSFIRREILALEEKGYDILRISVRKATNKLVDPQDIQEAQKTFTVLREGVFKILFLTFLTLLRNPFSFLITFIDAIKLGWGSERGVFKHIIYFIEACVIINKCKSEDVDHIHAHFGTNSTMLALLVKKVSGITYSMTIHGSEEFDKPRFISLKEKIEDAEFICAISSYGRSQLYRHVSYDHWDKIKVMHCGINRSFYEGDVPKIPTENNFINIGRLCEQKGQILLLKAMKKLKDKGKEFHLTFVGDGPMRATLEKYIQENNLSYNVTITGWLSSGQIRGYIEKSKCLIMSSFAEGLPVVIMEAMALGRPVISTRITGIPELVIDRENGWLVTAGDVNQLYDKIENVMELNSNELIKISQKARQRVLERHNIEKEILKLDKYFSEIKKEKQAV